MAQNPRLWNVAGIQGDDRLVFMDLYQRLSKAQWCELFFHLYINTHGQGEIILAADDIQERIKVIEEYCAATGPLGKI